MTSFHSCTSLQILRRKQWIWKTFLFIIFDLFIVWEASSQNLVPNPSFEEKVECPVYADNIDDALGWFTCSWSPDYFNPCANLTTPFMGVPQNAGGFQYPYDGIAYAGVATYTTIFPYPYRECIGIQLVNQLTSGTRYFVSAYVSRADTTDVDCATNKLGFRFSTIQYSVFNPVPIDNFSQVHSDSIILDKYNWTHIYGSFTSDSAYKYVMFGNFYDDAQTDTFDCPSSFNNVAYYYVDLISVSQDSVLYTPVNEFHNNTSIIFFPNPVSLIFQSNLSGRFIDFYTISNLFGQVIKEGEFHSQNFSFDVSDIPNGIYSITLNHIYSSKFIVHH